MKTTKIDLVIDKSECDSLEGCESTRKRISGYITNLKIELKRIEKKYDKYYLNSSDYKQAKKWKSKLTEAEDRLYVLEHRLKFVDKYEQEIKGE
jgi:hypothetical protein